MMFFLLFGVVGGHTVIETARDALFLGTVPARQLAIVYAVVAVLALAVVRANRVLARTVGSRNGLIVSLIVAAFGNTLLHQRPPSATMVFVLYVWTALVGSLVLAQFWLVAARLFTPAQGKRLFPTISAGGVLGAMCGAGVAAVALRFVDSQRLLLLGSALFFGVALLATRIRVEDQDLRRASESPGSALGRASLELRHEVQPQPEGSAKNSSDTRRVRGYVRRIGALTVVSTSALLLTDYLFKSTIAARIPSAELGSYLARYYVAFNAAALVTQVLLARWIVQRVGVAFALSILPLLLALGSVGVVVAAGALAPVVFTKGADGALKHSLHRISSELLQLPLPAEVRERVRPFLDLVLFRATQGVTAAALFALALVGVDSPRVLAVVLATLAAAWAFIAIGLKRPYLDLFRGALGSPSWDPWLRMRDLDLNSAEQVIEALSRPEPHRVIAALNLLNEARHTRLIPALILYHESPEVLIRALEILPSTTRRDWVGLAERLMRHESEAVRIGVARAFARTGHFDKLEGWSDRSEAVSAHLTFHLASRDPRANLLQDEALAKAMQGASGERVEACRALLSAIQDDPEPRFAEVVLTIARDPHPDLIVPLARTMARLPDPRFVGLLIPWLEKRLWRAAARAGLARQGEPALAALEQALADPSKPVRLRLHIPRAVARFSSRRAAELLLAALYSGQEGAVRFKSLQALARMSQRRPLEIEPERWIPALRGNLEEFFKAEALRQGALVTLTTGPADARESGEVLIRLLGDKVAQARQRIFLLIHLMHPEEDIRSVSSLLDSKDVRQRGHAAEFLDTLTLGLDESLRELLRLLADDLPTKERLGEAATYVEGMATDAAMTLRELLADADRWVKGLAAYFVLRARLVDLEEIANEALHESGLVAPPALDSVREGRACNE